MYQLFGDWLAQGHGDVLDRLTPLILLILGGLIVALMLYAYFVVPHA